MKLMNKSGANSGTSPRAKKSISSDGQSYALEEYKESKISSLMGGGTKTDNLVMSLQGVRIGDNPTEREVFLQCPRCKIDVFDSGLSNDLV